MTVTIWDTTANAGAGGIARVATTVHTPDPQDPEAPGTTEIVYGDPLARLADTKENGPWFRKPWLGTARQADPAGAGARNFEAGWVILVDNYVTPALGADEVRSALGDTPVVDLGNLTATWTYGVVAKPVAARKAAMRAAATAKFREVVAAGKVIGGVKVDLTAEGFERLGQAHAALAAGAGPIKAVTVRGGRIDLPDAATCASVIAAARAHYLAAAGTERALYDAVDAAADHAALDLIDVAAGTVAVAGEPTGGWPSNA